MSPVTVEGRLCATRRLRWSRLRADATPAQIEAALSELRAREGELQAAAHGALAAAITALPPEVRAQWRANGRNGP